MQAISKQDEGVMSEQTDWAQEKAAELVRWSLSETIPPTMNHIEDAIATRLREAEQRGVDQTAAIIINSFERERTVIVKERVDDAVMTGPTLLEFLDRLISAIQKGAASAEQKSWADVLHEAREEGRRGGLEEAAMKCSEMSVVHSDDYKLRSLSEDSIRARAYANASTVIRALAASERMRNKLAN